MAKLQHSAYTTLGINDSMILIISKLSHSTLAFMPLSTLSGIKASVVMPNVNVLSVVMLCVVAATIDKKSHFQLSPKFGC